MPAQITLTFDLTTKQKAKLDRWFARWNPVQPTPFATLEDALKQLLTDNVKSFISEDNLLKLPMLGDAMTSAPEEVQEIVLDALGPYMS